MRRSMTLSVRVSCEERDLLTMIATHLERSESDAVRQIIRDSGRLLGIVPDSLKQREEDTHAKTSIVARHSDIQ